MFHAVNFESGEVAGNNPAGVLGQRQACGISPCLLVRGKFLPVRLAVLGAEVHVGAFLLNQHLCGRDIAIDEIVLIL